MRDEFLVESWLNGIVVAKSERGLSLNMYFVDRVGLPQDDMSYRG